jgi:hypothetical protein
MTFPRRIPALVLLLAVIAGVVLTQRATAERDVPTFSVTAQGWMPAAPSTSGLLESWFCPGVPATGVDGVEGRLVMANRTDTTLEGTVLVFNDAVEERRLALSIDPWATATLDLDATLPGNIVGAVVEIEGGGALVEQYASHPDGDSVSTCANATSDQWFLADGYTVDGSLDQVLLANPFDQTVVVNVEFATEAGFRDPGSYKGLTVAPRSVRAIDLGAPGAGAQSEPVLAVSVRATRGRLVVGRSQLFAGSERSGAQVTLATPALREQWWFADGVASSVGSEDYVIYNPTPDPVDVDVVFLGIATPAFVEAIEVPPREAVTFDARTVPELPDGGHAAVFATADGTPSIVVDRVVTRRIEDASGTGVLTGAVVRQDGYSPTTWYVPEGPATATEGALVVHNVDNSPGTISVFAVGRSGPVPVDGLVDVPYGAAERFTLDLVDPLVLGRQLVIEATTHVFVERSFPNGVGELRTPSWAIPAG